MNNHTHVIVGTAGHIDHGKTSLVRRLTGIDTDRLPEEKARGISIDLGFAHFEADEFQFGVVDVPGHERFVRNMVAGATGVDLALLIVAADDGVMPQTIEHLEIMDLLGVATGAIVITKIDLVDADFVELVKAEVADRTQGTFLEGAPIVLVSSQTGAGIDDLKRTLVEIARRSAWPSRGELFRMPIDRVFSVVGHGTVVTGSVLGGEVHPGDMVELLPRQQSVRVRGVQTHGQQAELSSARQRTAINLAGLKTEEVHRGEELATPGFLRPARRLLVSVRCLSSSPVTLRDRLQLLLHLGTREVAARVILKGTILGPGSTGFAELRLAESVVAAYGQRYILRRPSPALTVAGGCILDPGIEPRIRMTDLQSTGAALQVADPAARLSRYLAGRDAVDPSPLAAAWKTGLAPSQYAKAIVALIDRGELVPMGAGESARRIHRDRAQALSTAIMKRIARELKNHQPRRALARKILVSACQTLAPLDLVNWLLDRLLATGKLVFVGSNIGPADAQAQLTKNQSATRNKILELIGQGGISPPTLKELATALGQKPEAIQVLLALCVEDGLLVDLGDGLYFSPAVLEQARQTCAAVLGKLGSATMSQLREAWGTTRKYAVPLCEYFDSRQLTTRAGDLRTAGPRLNEPLA